MLPTPTSLVVPPQRLWGRTAILRARRSRRLLTQDGAWFDYTFPNPTTKGAETKHSWTVRHDGLVFTSGWYERGPRKSDAPAYTKAFVQQALNLLRRPRS